MNFASQLVYESMRVTRKVFLTLFQIIFREFAYDRGLRIVPRR